MIVSILITMKVIITDTEESDQSPATDVNKTQATHRIHLDYRSKEK